MQLGKPFGYMRWTEIAHQISTIRDEVLDVLTEYYTEGRMTEEEAFLALEEFTSNVEQDLRDRLQVANTAAGDDQ